VADLRTQVSDLEAMDLQALREAWSARYGEAPKLRSPDLLRRLMAFRIQAQAEAAPLQALRRRLAEANRPPRRTEVQVGRRIVREWKGVRHDVEAIDAGFLYQGQVYASLSQIARMITGSRWNGPRFFGLRTLREDRRGRSS
jgi:hypothetical protein